MNKRHSGVTIVALFDFGKNLTYHVLMFCFANGDIMRQISAVADRLTGSMLSIGVSTAKTRCTATAWAIRTNSALQIPSANKLAHVQFKLYEHSLA
jgi:hypothetical protein